MHPVQMKRKLDSHIDMGKRVVQILSFHFRFRNLTQDITSQNLILFLGIISCFFLSCSIVSDSGRMSQKSFSFFGKNFQKSHCLFHMTESDQSMIIPLALCLCEIRTVPPVSSLCLNHYTTLAFIYYLHFFFCARESLIFLLCKRITVTEK